MNETKYRVIILLVGLAMATGCDPGTEDMAPRAGSNGSDASSEIEADWHDDEVEHIVAEVAQIIPDPGSPSIDDLMSSPNIQGAPACYRYASDSQYLGPGQASATSMSCNAGQTMTGGGFKTSSTGALMVYENYPSGATTWRAAFRNVSDVVGTTYGVWVRCCVL